MNRIHSLLTSSLLAAALAAPAVAGAATAPTPDRIVAPTQLSRAYADARVTVKFTVDRQGNVHDVKAAEPMPAGLAARVLPAVAQWHFKPSLDAQGAPVARVVILPLRIADIGA